jgi:hypothetical protein
MNVVTESIMKFNSTSKNREEMKKGKEIYSSCKYTDIYIYIYIYTCLYFRLRSKNGPLHDTRD